MAQPSAPIPVNAVPIDFGEKVSTELSHVEAVAPPEYGMSSGEEEDVKPKLTKETILAFIAIAGQINAYIMTLLIPSTSLSYINADLGPDPNYPWITVVWQLGAAIIVSVGGRLSDIFGRRYFMITGAVISIVGCLVGANGKSINMMIASGALFGIGSGFQEMCYACIQEMVPNRYRMVGVGMLDVFLAIAFVSPVVAYCFIAYQEISWRGAYWYMFSWHVAAFIFLVAFYHPPDFAIKHRADGKTKMQLLGELDYVGVVLFTAAGTLFLLGINFGGRTYPWSDAHVIAPIVVGLVCYIVLGFWEVYADLKYPLLPPKLFKKVRAFVMVIVVCFVGGMLYYSMNVLWPRQSQLFFVPANEPVMRGVYAMIFSCGTFLGGIIMVFVCSRLHHEKWQLVFFMIAQTALIGSLASVGIGDKAQAIVIIVVGAAMVTPPQLISFTMLSLGLDDQTDIGIAVGLAGTFRLLGGAIATAIYTAILTGRFDSTLTSHMEDAIEASSVPYSSSLLGDLIAAAQTNTAAAYAAVQGATSELASAAALATKYAYVDAFKLVYLVAIAFGGAATIAAFCTVSTDRKLKNNQRAITLKNERASGTEGEKGAAAMV
ncbi:putative trichothecene efflux pump protein [Zalerion maritima]|uniref:Trichothecene efflux pump protein n=1 Tax=Zalerion maritima TaxID=339359 RepID=A0AAD5WTG1_9PEZI|nr:putative trichothecene efflux pump protein [Zalerion maritima]